MGIQLVNRERGSSGDERNPAAADDREGHEWLWMRHASFSWSTYKTSGTPPRNLENWWVPTWNVGGFDEHIDVRVMRKLDLSQDELLFSVAGHNQFGSNQAFDMIVNLRLLLMLS